MRLWVSVTACIERFHPQASRGAYRCGKVGADGLFVRRKTPARAARFAQCVPGRLPKVGAVYRRLVGAHDFF
jgi:hypothetical protein